MGNCSCRMALLLQFLMTPCPGANGTDNRLSTGVDMDVLDCDALLLTFATTAIEHLRAIADWRIARSQAVAALRRPAPTCRDRTGARAADQGVPARRATVQSRCQAAHGDAS